jgi:DNA-binding MarR family transcriptional regulator
MSRQPQLKPVPLIIGEIRRLAPLLAEIGEALHAAAGLGAPARRVLERLVDGGAATVPALAEAEGVTRQHIQTVVNELHDNELVMLTENPRHRRSKLVAATERGTATLAEIRVREAPIGSKLAAAISPEDAAVAAAALAALREKLEAIVAQ